MIEISFKIFIFVALFAFVCLLFGTLILRRKLLSYLKENYIETYNEIVVPNLSPKDIFMGGPDVVKRLIMQDMKLLSKEICYDNNIGAIQNKLKITGISAIIVALIWIVSVLSFSIK